LGVAGAACIVRNKITGRVDWVCFSGLSAEFEADYVDYYAPLDPLSPLLNVSAGWTKLSECLPGSFLKKSEWYNDFVLECGVRDILGTRLVDTTNHLVIFGLHQQIGRSFSDGTALVLADVNPLRSTAQRYIEILFGPVDTDADTVANGPRYYFHLRNGKQYPDEAGTVFSTPMEAVAHASRLALELGQDKDWDGFVVAVTDERGNEIARVPVKETRRER
jgi:hypothetical protein